MTDQVAASERLVDGLVAEISQSGRVLDAGCGEGATTWRLLQWWDPSNVLGINIRDQPVQSPASAHHNISGKNYYGQKVYHE